MHVASCMNDLHNILIVFLRLMKHVVATFNTLSAVVCLHGGVMYGPTCMSAIQYLVWTCDMQWGSSCTRVKVEQLSCV